MPVKKHSKKNHTKDTEKKVAEIQKEIKKAELAVPPVAETVEEIFPILQNKPTTPKENIINEYQDRKKKKTWVWVSVIIFSAVIFFIWAWNLYVLTVDISQKKNNNPFGDASQEFNKIITQANSPSDNLQKTTTTIKDQNSEQVKNSLKQALLQAIAVNINSAITTSTTSTTTVSSTISTTTSKTFPISDKKTNKSIIK